MSFDIILAEPQHQTAINDLLEHCFGPGRLARTAERLREGNVPIAKLSHLAMDDKNAIVGAISFWPIRIGDAPALLLGPLAVHHAMQGQGVGLRLMQAGLQAIDAARFPHVLLVGDLPYYARIGFEIAPPSIAMPGPVNSARLLLRGADMGADGDALSGMVRPAPDLC